MHWLSGLCKIIDLDGISGPITQIFVLINQIVLPLTYQAAGLGELVTYKNAFFLQSYFIYHDFYKPGGPGFLVIGAEIAASGGSCY